MPDVLYEEVIEVDERVVLRQDGCQLPRKDPERVVTGASGSCALPLLLISSAVLAVCGFRFLVHPELVHHIGLILYLLNISRLSVSV